MKGIRWGVILAAGSIQAAEPVTSPGPAPLADVPSIETVSKAMTRAGRFYRTQLSYAGGYGTEWPEDLSETRVEGRASPSVISIQPPGTPTVGMAMLEAWRVTEDPVFLQAAKEAAQALIWCQLASGGWDSSFDFDRSRASRLHFRRDLEAGDVWAGRRSTASTLDDNKTQSALHFLLELAHEPAMQGHEELRSALDFGLDGLLAAQAPNGGWPQRFSGPADAELPEHSARFPESWSREFPNTDYTPFYTTNDGNLLHVLKLLLRADALEGGVRYRQAIDRLGEFLLLAQMPEPQRGWAQQYNFEMEPAWARKFEPPAVSAGETLSVLNTLLELWLVSDDDRYLQAMEEGIAWLKSVPLEDGRWARFYELETNRPLYCEAETYRVTYDDANLPTHYGFQIDIGSKVTRLEASLEKGREKLLEERQTRSRSEKEWAGRAKGQAKEVRSILKAQDRLGYWEDGNVIEVRLLAQHFADLCDYMKMAKAGGEIFRDLSDPLEKRKAIRSAGLVATEQKAPGLESMIRDAASRGCRVVVLPEAAEAWARDWDPMALEQELGIDLAWGETIVRGVTIVVDESRYSANRGDETLAEKTLVPTEEEPHPNDLFYFDHEWQEGDG